MYAEDITLTCIGETVDRVETKINKALGPVSDWCHRNSMTVHPEKSEAMLIKWGVFVGPLQPVCLNGKQVKWVRKSRSLEIVVDNHLKWAEHVQEVQLSFARKLNLLIKVDVLSTEINAGKLLLESNISLGYVWHCNLGKL